MKRPLVAAILLTLLLAILGSQSLVSANALGQINMDLYFADSIDMYTPGVIFSNSGNISTPCDLGFANAACTSGYKKR